MMRRYVLFQNIPAHQFIYRLTGYAQYPDSLRTLGVNAFPYGNPFALMNDWK